MGAAQAQTPAAPTPPPTIRNSTTVPPAPVKAGNDQGSAGEMPLNTAGEQPATDAAPAGSPVMAGARAGYFLPGTALHLRLSQGIDSGHQRNGDSVKGVLLVPVKAANGKVLGKGTPISATVVSSAAAGTMRSFGVLSLQVYRVGDVGVFTDVLDFDGQEGHKDLPDSAPDKGTEASVAPGAILTFKVQGAGDNPDLVDRGGRRNGGGSQGVVTPGGAPGTTPAPGMTTPH